MTYDPEYSYVNSNSKNEKKALREFKPLMLKKTKKINFKSILSGWGLNGGQIKRQVQDLKSAIQKGKLDKELENLGYMSIRKQLGSVDMCDILLPNKKQNSRND